MPDCVLLDTSSLLFGVENNIDLFEQVRLAMPGAKIIIPEPVLKELDRMKAEKSRRGAQARVVLELIDKNEKLVVESNEKADDAIVIISAKRGCSVVTNDTALRKRLREQNIRVFTLTFDRKLKL